MSIRITKTSTQALIEEKNRLRCPECSSTRYFGSYHYESSGFFSSKRTKVSSYRCSDCKCEFEVRI